MPEPATQLATLHIDGASRGNPGPAAYAVVLARPGSPPIELAEVIGTTTNNVAEYTALVEGLALAAELGVKRLAVFSDSELLVKQMRGEYRVRSGELRGLYERAKRLADGFEEFCVAHLPREQNRRADAIANEALDGRPRRRDQPPPPLPPAASSLPPAAPSPASAIPKPPRRSASVSDAAVREQALEVLRSAARTWAAEGVAAVPVEAVWEQLWSVLDESGLLKRSSGGG